MGDEVVVHLRTRPDGLDNNESSAGPAGGAAGLTELPIILTGIGATLAGGTASRSPAAVSMSPARAGREGFFVSFADEVLAKVRNKIEPTNEPLNEARERLQLVRDAADSFPGRNRTYRSGSLAVHTMNEPVTDGDGGLVLNRSNYPQLGPDGGGAIPDDVVEDLREHLRPIIRRTYPDAVISFSKRGPKIHFHQPLSDGQDPTVDLVVALTRKEGPGLWIPNLKTSAWEPSHPERHVELLNGDTPSFRAIRRKVVRLAKAWNKTTFGTPLAASFVLSVWAWEFLEPGTGVATGLRTLFTEAADRLESGDHTPDPAGVSADLQIDISDAAAVNRLRKAAGAVDAAISADTLGDAQSALAIVFPKYVDDPMINQLSVAASVLRPGKAVGAALLGVSGIGASTTPGARSYGDGNY